MAAIRLAGLRPQVYEHPSDAAALNALNNTAGFDGLIQKLNAWGIDRLLRVQLTGSYIRVKPDSFPDLYRILIDVRNRLDVPVDVDMYIAAGSEINAFTAGVERPLIVLNSATVELLSDEELSYVIGHELGHIKSGHILYYQIADMIPLIAGVIGSVTFGVGELLSAAIQMALLHWKKMSEFTADRAGLLGCQNAEVAWRTLTKLAGLPPKYYATINTEDLLEQARDFQALDTGAPAKIVKWLSSVGATHPWTVVRAQQLDLWLSSGGYEQTLKFPRGAPHQVAAVHSWFCTDCGYSLRGTETFCPECGSTVGAVAPPIP